MNQVKDLIEEFEVMWLDADHLGYKVTVVKRASSYRRIQPGEPMFEMAQANKRAKLWVCDSADHNEEGGCSNPECFKHKYKKAGSKDRNARTRATKAGNPKP